MTDAGREQNTPVHGESDYRQLFENSDRGTLILAPDGKVADANRRAGEILQRTRDQLLAADFHDLLEHSSVSLSDASGGRGAAHDGMSLIGPDGGAIGVRAQFVSLDGGNVGVMLRDAEEGEKGEQPSRPAGRRSNTEEIEGADDGVRTRLRDVESKYRSIFDNAVEGIFRTTADGRLSKVNPAMARMFGYGSPEEMLAHIPDTGQLYVVPEQREKLTSLMRQSDVVSGFQIEVRRRCGETFWISANIWTSRDADGEFTGYEGTIEDITERKTAEDKLKRSMDALFAIYEASQILNSTLESEEVGSGLLKIMQRASSLTAAVISVPDEERQPRVWRAVGLENLWRKARYSPEAWMTLGDVLDTGEHRWFRLRHSDVDGSLVGLHMPLKARDRVIGVLEVYGPEVLKDDEMVELLISLTSKAASALENAQLYEKLAERERQLHDLVGRLLNAQEEERRRVAYEVHDGLTQMLVASYHRLQALAKRQPPDSRADRNMLRETLEFVRQTVEEARRVIAALRPTALDDFGLAVAVRQQVETLNSERWRISYTENLGNERLPVATETALYRVVQEALNNIRKHAQTVRVEVDLCRTKQMLLLRVRDWGRGFELNGSARSESGVGERLGLSSMRERIALVGGELKVRSKVGVGTLVAAEVPLHGGLRVEDAAEQLLEGVG